MSATANKRTSGLGPGASGLFRPTTKPKSKPPEVADPDRESESSGSDPVPEPVISGQGGADVETSHEADASTTDRPVRKRRARNAIAKKAETETVEGRKLYLPEHIHFRLRMLAYQKGCSLSEAAADVLDQALPRWRVERDS